MEVAIVSGKPNPTFRFHAPLRLPRVRPRSLFEAFDGAQPPVSQALERPELRRELRSFSGRALAGLAMAAASHARTDQWPQAILFLSFLVLGRMLFWAWWLPAIRFLSFLGF